MNNTDALEIENDLDISASGLENTVDSHGIAHAIIFSSLAIVSMISSSIVVWLILHSKSKLTSIYHRILLGMSFGDFLYSLGGAHFNAMAPSDVNYIVWNARGNLATCTAQGFVTLFGAAVTLVYSCSLNLYYVAVVKYQKSDNYIRMKIEPFLHGFPLVYALVSCTTLLAKKNLNNGGGGICYAAVYDPPHCSGYEDGQIPDGFVIPCGRGRDGLVGLFYGLMLMTLFVVPIVVGVSLIVIYRFVSKQERKNARYGGSALNITSLGNVSNATNEEGSNPGFVEAIRSLFHRIKTSFACCGMTSSQNEQLSMSQKVLHRATAYSTAYLLAWSPFILGYSLYIAGLGWPLVVEYITNIFNPLQGFFNCCIFLYPKVTEAKSRGGEGMTWSQAVAKAFGLKRFDQNEGKREKQHNISSTPNISSTQGTALSGRNSSLLTLPEVKPDRLS